MSCIHLIRIPRAAYAWLGYQEFYEPGDHMYVQAIPQDSVLLFGGNVLWDSCKKTTQNHYVTYYPMNKTKQILIFRLVFPNIVK